MRCFLREQLGQLLVVLVSMLCEWLNHLLVVLVSILACLWFLSVLVASSPYLTLRGLIVICMYFFKMPTIILAQQLIQHADYAFSIGIQDTYLHIPIVKHHHCFLQFVWHNMPYQWKVLPFGLATAPLVFTALTKPILFLCHCKGFCIVIYLDDILVLVHSKWAGKRACSFLCSLLVWLGLHINFSMSDLCLTQTFCFLGLLLGYCPCVSMFTSW